MTSFHTKRLPTAPDVVAPDGSDVRILLALPSGSMAHFELAPGQTSAPVAHRTVEEIWYFLRGRGEMWRKLQRTRSGSHRHTRRLPHHPRRHPLPVSLARPRAARRPRHHHATLARRTTKPTPSPGKWPPSPPPPIALAAPDSPTAIKDRGHSLGQPPLVA